MFLTFLFWFALFYLAYVEVGYLIVLSLIVKLKPASSLAIKDEYPTITVLVAAHNEEKVIRQRLENILAQEYPVERLQVIVASDYSGDRTDDIVREYATQNVLLCRSTQHGGKIAALRTAEPFITGQVVVFTDADASFQPGALQALARHFSNPTVGAVTGREVRPPSDAGKGEGLFNRIETKTKRLEGLVGDQVLLHGGIFAMRRDLLPYVPDHLTHDAIVPANLVLKGYRVLYEPEAVSVEAYDLDTVGDWKRRIRTVMQAFQSYFYVKGALNPLRAGWYALQIWLHRYMRWFVFPVLLLALFSNLALLGRSPLYQALALVQAACYLLALIGFWLDRQGKQPRLFYIPFYFVYIHLAAIYAILLSWKGKRFTTWQTAQRQVVWPQDEEEGAA